MVKKLFKELDHLRMYKDECIEYLVAQECENGSGERNGNAVPAFLPEVMTSIFAVLLFIKYTLLGLGGLLVLFLGLFVACLC